VPGVPKLLERAEKVVAPDFLDFLGKPQYQLTRPVGGILSSASIQTFPVVSVAVT
jgi:hypothetical protein